MNIKKTIIVTSISNCQEKNGIVTFMEILKSNSNFFSQNGLKLKFINYVNPKRIEKKNTFEIKGKSEGNIQSSHGYDKNIKLKIKKILASHPFLAFLYFLGTYGMKGLITAIKAQEYKNSNCVYFYQDFLTAFFGFFLHRNSTRNVIILHSGDDALSQLFAHFHGMVGTMYEKIIRRSFEWTLNKQNVIVTLSEKYAEDLRKTYKNKDIKCIYNTSPFCGKNNIIVSNKNIKEKVKIIAVGTLQYRKGFDMLIKSIAAMKSEDRDKISVTIVGGGQSQSELTKLIDTNKLNQTITLAGESNNVDEFLSKSDAYILTSRDEGLPISLIEACSFGLPILTTAVGSIPEIFDETSCKLMDPTVESIEKMLTLLSQGKIDLDELSIQSRRIFDEKLSLDKFLNAYVCVLA